jgi:hypothetical protein
LSALFQGGLSSVCLRFVLEIANFGEIRPKDPLRRKTGTNYDGNRSHSIRMGGGEKEFSQKPCRSVVETRNLNVAAILSIYSTGG